MYSSCKNWCHKIPFLNPTSVLSDVLYIEISIIHATHWLILFLHNNWEVNFYVLLFLLIPPHYSTSWFRVAIQYLVTICKHLMPYHFVIEKISPIAAISFTFFFKIFSLWQGRYFYLVSSQGCCSWVSICFVCQIQRVW